MATENGYSQHVNYELKRMCGKENDAARGYFEGQGGLYTFLRNEPNFFRTENCIYPSGAQDVVR